MALVCLVARRVFPYAGRTVVAGEVFEAQSERDALLLTAIGHAMPLPDDRVRAEPA